MKTNVSAIFLFFLVPSIAVALAPSAPPPAAPTTFPTITNQAAPYRLDIAPAPSVGPDAPAAIDPDTRALLEMLRDRKKTLQDFTAKIDYSVEDRGDVTGKRGTVDFIMDPARGPTFSANFTINTVDGTPKLAYHTQFIFDGKLLTVKDFGTKDNVKQFIRTDMLPKGAKPGDAVTLNGALPLPIGLEVDEVTRSFTVTMPADKNKNADVSVLKLVPRAKGKFDYSALEVTVDKKLQLPTKLIQTNLGENGSTTVSFTDIKINTNTAKMLDSSTPATDGWTERK